MRTFSILMVIFVAVGVLSGFGCCHHENRSHDGCMRPAPVQQPAPAVSVVYAKPASAVCPVAVQSQSAPMCGPVYVETTTHDNRMFLKQVYVLQKGANDPELMTFVCLHVPEAEHGNQAYVGELQPDMALPPGTHLERAEINNHGKWISVWAVR